MSRGKVKNKALWKKLSNGVSAVMAKGVFLVLLLLMVMYLYLWNKHATSIEEFSTFLTGNSYNVLVRDIKAICGIGASTSEAVKKSFMISDVKRQIAEHRLESLKKQSNYINNIQYEFIATSVHNIITNAGGVYLIIPVGKQNDISRGNAVINSQGLVGLVISVTEHFAKVSLVGNVDLAIAGHVGQEYSALLRGEGNLSRLLYAQYDKGHAKDGDNIMTKSTAQVPEGLLIGSVQRKGDKIFVSPNVEVDKLDIVIIARQNNGKEFTNKHVGSGG